MVLGQYDIITWQMTAVLVKWKREASVDKDGIWCEEDKQKAVQCQLVNETGESCT